MVCASFLRAGPEVWTRTCGQVAIQRLQVFEYTDARQRLNDGENLLNLGLHIHKGRVAAAAGHHLFPRDLEQAQSRTADEFEASQVEDQIVDRSGKDQGHL